jgi:hypothetical protein
MPENIASCTKIYVALNWEVATCEHSLLLLKVNRLHKMKFIPFADSEFFM